MEVIAVGPFVGDLETEILSFRPYVSWIYNNAKYDRFYVSSHYHSRFLYDFLEDEQFIHSISKELSDNKDFQQKYFHLKIEHKNFLKYTRDFRNKIFNSSTEIKKEEIKIIGIPYTKLNDPIIQAKKIFKKIKTEETKGQYILYDKDPIIKNLEYKTIENCSSSYDLIKLVSNARCVVCKAGFLTSLANLQGIPVFSWCTDYPGRYRVEGIYNFGNKKINIMYCCDEQFSVIERALTTFLVGL